MLRLFVFIHLLNYHFSQSRYEQLLVDKAEFDKSIAKRKPASKKDKPFEVPKGLRNITTSDIPPPDVELVRQDLAELKKEFIVKKYGQYIDVYKGIHAMLKSMYRFEKYLEPGLKRRCSKWCYDFNYANNALKLITGKKKNLTRLILH